MSETSTEATPRSGSYLMPSFQHARVADAMRPGLISCPPDSSMRDVARIMSTNHVHAVVVRGVAGGGGCGGPGRRLVRIRSARNRRAGGAAGGRMRADARTLGVARHGRRPEQQPAARRRIDA